MSTSNLSSKSAGAGLFASIVASLCCITPVFSFLAGIGGIASTFSWMEPFRPYLITLTIAILGLAWYQKLKPREADRVACACEEGDLSAVALAKAGKPSFWQTKKFLGIVTIFAAIMLAFPSYSHLFYPESNEKSVTVISNSGIKAVDLKIDGMTCSGCEAHVTNAINELEGIRETKASYENGNAIVQFDPDKVSREEIVEAINKTGYKVVNKPSQN